MLSLIEYQESNSNDEIDNMVANKGRKAIIAYYNTKKTTDGVLRTRWLARVHRNGHQFLIH